MSKLSTSMLVAFGAANAYMIELNKRKQELLRQQAQQQSQQWQQQQ